MIGSVPNAPQIYLHVVTVFEILKTSFIPDCDVVPLVDQVQRHQYSSSDVAPNLHEVNLQIHSAYVKSSAAVHTVELNKENPNIIPEKLKANDSRYSDQAAYNTLTMREVLVLCMFTITEFSAESMASCDGFSRRPALMLTNCAPLGQRRSAGQWPYSKAQHQTNSKEMSQCNQKPKRQNPC